MKLKYYLRGLGAGILFSVLVFSFVVGPRENDISDEEIILRAKQLGLVEENKLSIDMDKLRGQDETVLSPSPAPSPTTVFTPTPTVALTPSPTVQPTATLTPTPTVPDKEEPVPTPEAENVITETITAVIEIKSGMRSEDICAVIENAGIVESALQLNAYLIQNGYAEQLRVGKFEINNLMTFEEIARHLTH